MEDIGIFIYSFQNKKLIENLSDIAIKSSGLNNLYFYVVDQNNIERSRNISIDLSHCKIVYKYIKWDSIKSPISYKKDAFRILNKKYFMVCGDGIELNSNWDLDLINKMNEVKYVNTTVISGNHKLVPFNKNQFIIDYKKIESENFEYNKCIDKDFLFCLSSDFKRVIFPEYLKYYGEDEEVSIFFKHSKIMSMPTNFLINRTVPLNNIQYVPFSLYHGYNKFVEKNKESILDIYGIEIKKLPFDGDDVVYDLARSQTDKIGGSRYINKTRIIN